MRWALAHYHRVEAEARASHRRITSVLGGTSTGSESGFGAVFVATARSFVAGYSLLCSGLRVSLQEGEAKRFRRLVCGPSVLEWEEDLGFYYFSKLMTQK
jgi:hypothetical protein